MKKYINYIILFCILLYSAGMMAQQGQGKMDKNRIKLLKISFITEEINLTSDEAEKFWPIYNKYNDKIFEARQELERGIQREIKHSGGVDNLSEEQSETIVQRMIALEESMSSNKIAMTKELHNVISANKIIKLQMAERNFNRKMLQEYGRRRRMN